MLSSLKSKRTVKETGSKLFSMGTRGHRSKKFVYGILLLVVMTLSGGAAWQTTRSDGPENVSRPSSDGSLPFTETEGRYLMNGTIFWGRAIEKWSQKPNGTYDYAHPFSGLNTFERNKYDAWVADLECPVMDIIIPYQTQIDSLVFNCRPEYLEQAAKYFDFINLANNHSGDKGQDGFLETRNRVQNAGMQTFGNYDPAVKHDICEIVALPIRLQGNGAEKNAALPVAFCSLNYFGATQQPGQIEHIKQYSKIMPTFAFVHMGTEYLTTAHEQQVTIAHQVIDAGADFVIANNPHWVQNTEVYKDKLIVYSTGNFIFDQIDAEGMRSVSVDVTMRADYDRNLENWLELGETCKKLHDDCFQQARSRGLSKPNYGLVYDVVAGDNAGRLTKKGSPSLQKAIETRMNWAQTAKLLEQD